MKTARITRITWAVLVVLVMCGYSFAEQTIYVDDDGPADFNNIQAAIEDSSDGDTIIVADGIYTGKGNRDIDYLGKAITLRSANGPLSCIVDCEGTYLDNHRGFYFHSGENENAVLDGFTITNGYIVTMCEGGAGIRIDSSSPTIRNCIIRGNVAELDPYSLCFCYGGGIYFNGTTLTMTNCIINDNSVGEFGLGGGICCMSGSNTIIRNCIISNNAATTPYDTAGQGGGIYLDYYANSLYMVNCTIAENTASSDGGGIYFEQYEETPDIRIINSIIWDNLPNQISTYGTDKGFVIYCDVQGGWPGPGPGGKPPNMDENPRFVDPDGDDNIFGTDDDNLRLLLGSPCIDAGDNSVVTVTTDLDGNPRIVNDTVDMGAYEFQGPYKRYYHVDCVNGDNSNDGLSRETAFETIQFAIDKTNDGDTVLVWPGVYNETATHGINFMGKAITVKSAADAAVLEVPGFTAVTFAQGEDGNSVFSNFVVRGSVTGIFALFANPTINNVTVVGNDNGVMADNSNPNITNSIFWNNINGDLFGSPDPITAQHSWLEDGLVAYWKLDGNATDSAGSNHGTIYGATPATGQVGGALSFDGDDYVQVADDDSLDISNEITISAWINPSSISSIRMIVAKSKDYAGMSYSLELRDEVLLFMLRDISHFFGIQTFSTGTWYHVAATYDGSRMKLYINGELDNEQAASGTIPITTQELNIGRQADNNLWPFEGLIDEVRIYDQGLSAEEIQAIYEAGLAGHEYGLLLFADANNGDYHLLSERGRYRATTDEWILDEVTNPCVDGGDPSVNPSNERMPNGGRINMGAYGNTAYASMSEWPIKGDVNNDGRFNFMDIAILLDGWLQELPWAQ